MSPDKNLRSFAREASRLMGESPQFAVAVAEFSTAAFYSKKFPAQEQKNYKDAAKKASREGILGDELGRARDLGIAAFRCFTDLPREEEKSPEEELMFQAKEVLEEVKRTKTLKKKRDIKRRQLEINFQRVLDGSDQSLRIINSNKRINFREDSVYLSLDFAHRYQMRDRTLKPQDYQTNVRKVSGDEIGLPFSVDPELLELAPGMLQKLLINDRNARLRYGEDRFLQLLSFVEVLLNGDVLTNAEIVAANLDPQSVIQYARRVFNHIHVQFSGMGFSRTRRDQSLISHSVVSQNPHIYLRDRSDRHSYE